MKKTLAAMLAVIIALACFPVAFAEDVTVTTLSENTTYADTTIPANTQLTVAEGVTLTITGTVTVNGIIDNQGTIINKGTLKVNNNIWNSGVIKNDATVVNKANISTNGKGVYATHVVVPATAAEDLYHVQIADNTVINHNTNVSKLYNDTYKLSGQYLGAANTGFDGYVQDGFSLYFTLNFDEVRTDPNKYVVYANGIRVYRDMHVYEVTPEAQAVTVSYSPYVSENLIKQIKIALPSGKGYRVVARGYTLDQAVNQQIDYILADYGTNVEFKVMILDGYHATDALTVTVDGAEKKSDGTFDTPTGDTFGYYHINGINDVEEYRITVLGVQSDESAEKLNGILETIRRVFATIMNVFNQIVNMFKNGLSL